MNFNNMDYYEMDKLNETYFKDDYNRMKKKRNTNVSRLKLLYLWWNSI